jgi:hypothetical protein
LRNVIGRVDYEHVTAVLADGGLEHARVGRSLWSAIVQWEVLKQSQLRGVRMQVGLIAYARNDVRLASEQLPAKALQLGAVLSNLDCSVILARQQPARR